MLLLCIQNKMGIGTAQVKEDFSRLSEEVNYCLKSCKDVWTTAAVAALTQNSLPG